MSDVRMFTVFQMLNSGISFLSTLEMSSTCDTFRRTTSKPDQQVELADFENNNIDDVTGMSTSEVSAVAMSILSNHDQTAVVTSQIHSKVSSQISQQMYDVTEIISTSTSKATDLPDLKSLDLNSCLSQTVQSHVRLGNLETTL